jgi:hypothetical protein
MGCTGNNKFEAKVVLTNVKVQAISRIQLLGKQHKIQHSITILIIS